MPRKCACGCLSGKRASGNGCDQRDQTGKHETYAAARTSTPRHEKAEPQPNRYDRERSRYDEGSDTDDECTGLTAAECVRKASKDRRGQKKSQEREWHR